MGRAKVTFMHIHLVRHLNLSDLDRYLSFLLELKKKKARCCHESLSDWAEREVKIACSHEDGYGAGCFRSALKAFRSLMDDGHSGFSIGITKAILDRLIDGKPLSPIEDVADQWNKCCYGDDEKTVYQNARMSALFKDVYPDGTVSFYDIDRVVLVEMEDDGTETTWNSGLASKIVDELVGPISLPYYPKDKPYKVYAQQFDSVNAEVGCYDTTRIIKVVDPDGNEIPCGRFYAETADGMVEIDEEEYLRRERSYKRMRAAHAKHKDA